MIVARSRSRALAVSLALLTLLPTVVPVAGAAHASDVPDVPTLPHARVGDECLGVTLSADVLAEVNRLITGGSAVFALDPEGLPALCDLDGRSVDQWRGLVSEADRLLEAFRNATDAVNDQYRARLEHTLPGGNREECAAIARTGAFAEEQGASVAGDPGAPGFACDTLHPEVTLLRERFDGRRLGGFGDWTVVTQQGEDPVLRPGQTVDFNGTTNTMRFGDDDGYERGAHQFLVSPEIDLSVVAGTQRSAQALLSLRESARGSLRALCAATLPGGQPGDPTLLGDACGRGDGLTLLTTPFLPDPLPGALIVEAYERAFDDVVAKSPVLQAGARLSFTYRVHTAQDLDGVRVWIYAGDEPPTRRELFGGVLQTASTDYECVGEYAAIPSQQPFAPCGTTECESDVDATCTSDPRVAKVLAFDGTRQTAAFQSGARVALKDQPFALTGDSGGFRTVTLNLTEFVPQRVWVLFEVRTLRDDRGGPFFEDRGVFPRAGEYGFDLARMDVVADGWHRNARVKDVGANYERMPARNPYQDAGSVRAVLPPGNEPIEVRLHNAGQYRENGTLALEVTLSRRVGAATQTQTATLLRPVEDLRSGEVRVERVTWTQIQGAGLFLAAGGVREGDRVQLTATLDLDKGNVNGVSANVTPINASRAHEPDTLAARTPNVAEADVPGGPTRHDQAGQSEVTVSSILRGYTRHAITPLPPPEGGNPLMVCDAIEEERCLYEFTAERGEPRILAVRIRNDGSTPETFPARLDLRRDGVLQNAVVQGDAVLDVPDLLPGEERLLQWTIIPTDPGVYEALVSFDLPDVPAEHDAVVQRAVYVQRTTGTICFDDVGASRLCAPSFSVDAPDALASQEIAALALDETGNPVVATAANRTAGGLYRRGDDGAWTLLANVSLGALGERFENSPAAARGFGPVAAMAFAPDGTLYLVGRNGTFLARAPAGDLVALAPQGGAPDVHFTDVAWFNGTAWATGTGGALYFVNGTRLDRVNLTYDRHREEPTTLSSALRRIVVHGDTAVVAGDHGFVFWSKGSHWRNDTRANLTLAWTNATTPERNPDWGRGRDALALLSTGAHVLLAGEDGLLLHSTDGKSFHNASRPTRSAPTADLVALLRTHLGEVFVVDEESRFASCGACAAPATAAWYYPSVPVPRVLLPEGGSRTARVVDAASAAGRTVAVAEGGLVLDFDDRSPFDNALDWDLTPTFVANKGAFQTIWNAPSADPQGFRGTLPDGASVSAEQFRVTVVHHVAQASPTDLATVRLLGAAVPSYSASVLANRASTCPSRTTTTDQTLNATCGLVVLGQPRTYAKATPTAGWIKEELHFVPQAGEQQLSLHAVEFHKVGSVVWAVDSVLVEAKRGNSWERVLAWDDATDPAANLGRWGVNRLGNDTSVSIGSVEPGVIWEYTLEPFNFNAVNAWHVTHDLADRPVWVVNDEIWPHEPGGSTPHLRSNWNMRLVSPVVDLSDAFDPVVEFRHAYAFRTYIAASSTPTRYNYPDGGVVEVQWLRTPDECHELGLESPCWSNFVPVQPLGGYPNASRALGIHGADSFEPEQTKVTYSDLTPIGPNAVQRKPGHSFWGRNVEPNEKGFIEGPASVDSPTYETVRIPLDDQRCRIGKEAPCVPVNLSGRQVRVAFHLVTPRTVIVDGAYIQDRYNHTNASQLTNPSSYAGEGWYVADFKVTGARKLGMDLAATDLAFRTGYDPARIGVGPGTDVPVNVTVTNRGAFEVPGYTGVLEVRRVVDPVAKRTEVVSTIRLGQQPALEPGLHQNHTFTWRVPSGEMKGYLLTFRVEPLGIDVDEDATDNLARLGTVVAPVLARTTRDFDVEFLVTPENATIDITRYVPIYLNNTGNVPLQGFEVRRIVTMQRPGAIPEIREWTAEGVVPAGTRVPLAYVSDGLNPATDLFWSAPDRASFDFRVEASTTGLSSSATRLVAAFATYLFDDVEGGPRGETARGPWTFDSNWTQASPGFLSDSAYTFGDLALGRYPAGANATAVTPLVDISGASSARLAFYHRYAFEERFDGGIVEASADGGKTWHALTPLPDRLNQLPGYNESLPLAAASKLHPTGDPRQPAYAFTGDSCELPAAVDCWILSEFDLTHFAPVREKDVIYEIHDSVALRGLGYANSSNGSIAIGAGAYTQAAWRTGEKPADNWSVQNLTATEVVPPTGDDTLWWSGSFLWNDDEQRPRRNTMLQIPVDLTAYAGDARKVVTVEWWEWVDRFEKTPLVIQSDGNALPDFSDLRRAFTWHNYASPSQAYRFNVTTPSVLEQRGQWYRLQADLTEWKGDRFDLGFVYAPIKRDGTSDADGYPTNLNNSNAVIAAFSQDRGFAIDGFTVRAFERVNGQVSDEKVLLDERSAWDQRTIRLCAAWDLSGPGASNTKALPCFRTESPEGSSRTRQTWGPTRNVTLDPSIGQTWHATGRVPSMAVSWNVTPVGVDVTGDAFTTTGEPTHAWYSGDTACVPNVNVHGARWEPCLPPGHESRLVSPPFDLSRVAGSSAILTFTHRYAFPLESRPTWEYVLASGGVVEIQRLDPQSNEWLPWEQLYQGSLDPLANEPGRSTSPQENARGGYSRFTANYTRGTDGSFRRLDSPFQPVHDPVEKRDLQFLYSGKSTDVCGATFGWCESTFDLTAYRGETVRFGFHVHMSGLNRERYAPDGVLTDMGADPTHLLRNPDGDRLHKGGWWITDVAVRSDVLKASPVEIRLRAATDGNVDDGRWQVDDLGLYGSRYRNNVGVFLDETPGQYGLISTGSVTVPLTLRNLGDSVRRNLAVEIIPAAGNAGGIKIAGTSPLGLEALPNGGARFAGYTLAPGQSTVVEVTFRSDNSLPDGHAGYTVRLREFNPTKQEFAPVQLNEVQGFLDRTLRLDLQNKGRVLLGAASVLPADPAPGQAVIVTLPVRNGGHGVLDVELDCTAELVTGWRTVNHRRDARPDEAIVEATYPCELLEGTLDDLEPHEERRLAYRVVTDAAGQLRFRLEGRVVDGVANETLPLRTVSVPVGRPLLLMREGFDDARGLAERWTSDAPRDRQWSAERGHREAGSLLLGLNESAPTAVATGGSRTYAADSRCTGGRCHAVTPPIDLHNQSSEGMFLTFWHMERLARGDGADVRVQVLLDEDRAERDEAWSESCRMTPIGGYEGPVLSYMYVPPEGSNDPPVTDVNPAYPAPPPTGTIRASPERYFVSDDGRWETTWSKAVFDLSQQTCADPVSGKPGAILGHTVRFVFSAYLANEVPGSALVRGPGHGWLVDDVSIGPLSVSVLPETPQAATLLDNTTKAFHVVLKNHGSFEDRVLLTFDESASSAPHGSVRPPEEPITLAPHETRIVPVEVTLPRSPSLLPTQYRVRVNVESVFDPNAGGSLGLDLVFAPREWAELAIHVEPPAEDVQDGTEAFIPVTVENVGLVPSVPSVVRVIDSYHGAPDVVTDLELPAMSSAFADADDSTRRLEFIWRPAKGTLGEHTLRFVVDPLRMGEEYTRVNNEAALPVEVVEVLIPDLDVAPTHALALRNAQGAALARSQDGDVVRYDVTAGDLVGLELTVRNEGRAGATDVEVLASIGPLNLPSKKIPYVPPGGEAIVKFNWLSQKGEYDLVFKVRSEQVEASTTNNDHPGRGVTRLTVKGYEVEAALAAVPGVQEPGTEVEVPFTLVNEGNAGEEIRLVARADGLELALERTAIFLREGETIEGVVSVKIPEHAVAGPHVISVQAVARENPMKVAAAETTLTVAAIHGGAVLATEARVAPPSFRLPVRLLNDGNSQEPWTISMRLPAGWTTLEALPARVVVPAYSEIVHEIVVNAPATTTPGAREIAIAATLPDGALREGVALVDVREVRSASARVAAQEPRAVDGALAYPVVVENAGNAAAPFEVILLGLPQGVEATLTPATFDLPPGGKSVATLLVKAGAGVEDGDLALRGYAMFEGVQPDTREGRANAHALAVRLARPDLRVGLVETTPRAEVEAGDRVEVRLPVENRGRTAVANLPVHLYVDDVFAVETTITLAPGERGEALLNWTAMPGDHTLTVVVDPYAQAAEAVREDNAASTLASVGAAGLAGGIAAGSPVPGPGAWGALVALAAALVVFRAQRGRRPPN